MRIVVAGGTGTVGRHVVDVVRERGLEPVVLARSAGVDVLSGAGLDDALQGADVVVDVTSIATSSASTATHFFRTASQHLIAAETLAGVGHHIALSIVGIDRVPHGYYAGKLAQEKVVENGRTPWSILRATQFHEFVAQGVASVRLGPIQIVPTAILQPVAAREVAETLVDLAAGGPAGRVRDLGGPQQQRLADMTRAYNAVHELNRRVLEVPLPGALGRAMRRRVLLPNPDARLGTQTFADWLRA